MALTRELSLHGDSIRPDPEMTLSELPFASVIIPVYDDTEALCQCLKALSRQTYPASRYEVIVVDNGSRQDLGPAVSVAAPNVTFAEERKVGSNAARNKGLDLSRGEVIAFTDSDCVPEENWLVRGARALLGASNGGLVGGGIDVYPKSPAAPTIEEIYDASTSLRQKFYIEDKHFASTANAFTFRSVLNHVGPFNEGLKSSGDNELGNRIFKAGYTLCYAPDAVVKHPARSTRAELVKKVKRLTGGFYDLEGKPNKTFVFWRRRLRDLLLPPVRFWLSETLKNPRLQRSFRLRFLYFWLGIYLHYAMTLEYVRLGFGRESQRS